MTGGHKLIKAAAVVIAFLQEGHITSLDVKIVAEQKHLLSQELEVLYKLLVTF